MKFLLYLFKGFTHWLSLILDILDFKDLSFMWIIIIGVLILSILDKSIIRSIFSFLKSLINVAKTGVGFIFLILLIAYYGYTILFFEGKLTIVVLLFSLWLLAKDYTKTGMNLMADSNNSIFDSIKEISIPILLLYLQQFISMFENNNFDNLLLISMSLIVIPIYSIMFFVFKHFANFEDIYIKYKRKLKLEGHYFMRIFNESLIESGNYQINKNVLNEFLKDNVSLEFEEMKEKLIIELPILIRKYKIQKKKEQKKEVNFSKVKKVFNIIWLLNTICLIDFVIRVRFFNGNFGFLYNYSLFILLIYMWIDLMKLKKIDNKSDFVIYGIIYIVSIIIILLYSNSLRAFRLSELGFIIPILILFHLRYFNKNFPNFLLMPNFSENNFFGMTMEQYYNSLNKNKK
jgi:hypothetical protein